MNNLTPRSEDRLCVVMPVYNEEAVVGTVLEKWHAALTNLGIDFVIRPYNDGSKDGSLAVMQGAAQRLGARIEVRDKTEELLADSCICDENVKGYYLPPGRSLVV